jgi:hypothetical protein
VKPTLFTSRIGKALLFGIALAIAFSCWPRTPAPAYFFEVTMRSSLPGFARLYYNAGRAANEANSVRLPVEGGNRDAGYKFPLPEGRLTNLRFDPSDQGHNTVVLSQLRIFYRGGGVVRTIQPSQFKPSPGIERLEVSAQELTLTTAAVADASFLTVELGEPLFFPNSTSLSWRTFIRRFVVSFLPAWAIALLLVQAFRHLKTRTEPLRLGVKIRTWSTNHPQQAVLAFSALFVTLSCYPVVFFGKSFVSPNNHSGTFLLYGEMPTVPGSSDVAADDPKGSDLGAPMWQNWPYSVVQARALFKYGELPLWNRYNATGRPLLGQGLSMCADPLQLVVLAARGASAAWDLKYILAKFLFAACIGLCVLQATRHLPAALLISATAPFIGFFSYRYSHPAFFSLCYAPAVLLCWFKLIDSRPGKQTALWLGAMVLADWTLLNAGGLKEAYILFLALNFCGLLALMPGKSIPGGKRTRLFQIFVVKVLFMAIAMPVWLTFFHALQNSVTVYDIGGAAQIKPSLLIGLFDDIFYRQFNFAEDHRDPSLNFLALVAVLWFLLSPLRVGPRNLSGSLAITSLIALAFVFGVVPASWITQVPLLRNIVHVDNTFSCVAIVSLLVLAGFGVKTYWIDSRAADFKRTCLRVTIVLVVLFALYLGTDGSRIGPMPQMSGAMGKSGFFWGYSLSLLMAAILLPWLGRFALLARRARTLRVTFVCLLLLLFCWRHGMHLSTPFDAYVMNPQRRVNLVADSSAALRLIKSRTAEPSRSTGLDSAFSPGYGGAVDLEQIDGPDPILPRHYRALIDASGAKLLLGSWRVGVSADLLRSEPLLFNMLNVRYYLGDVGPKVELAPSVKKIASLDLDVYESERVWPRAFFTDRLAEYRQEAEFVELIRKGDGVPFAAVAREDLVQRKELTDLVGNSALTESRQVMPARDYILTSNTTSFTVTAPGPGVVVLTEAFVPGDFQLRLNGKPADYFRVNSAFKGLFVDKAGDYTISYSYWPRYFTFSLIAAAAGLAALLGWLAIMAKGGPPPRKLASCATP